MLLVIKGDWLVSLFKHTHTHHTKHQATHHKPRRGAKEEAEAERERIRRRRMKIRRSGNCAAIQFCGHRLQKAERYIRHTLCCLSLILSLSLLFLRVNVCTTLCTAVLPWKQLLSSSLSLSSSSSLFYSCLLFQSLPHFASRISGQFMYICSLCEAEWKSASN